MASASDAASLPAEEQQTFDLVQQLLQSFQDGPSGMAFACGGTVVIPDADATVSFPQVTLRWDPSSKSVPASECKLQFPLDESDSTTQHNMQQLLHDMQPATVGYPGQNVLDAAYRKAYKMDPSDFACNTSPYELEIFDDVARILLPVFKDEANLASTNKPVWGPPGERIEQCHMSAELHQLNVYTGPSGHFKAHVDTPRSPNQIGFLVLCLPSIHEGGQLEVRHGGQTMTFDWSMPDIARPEIQWAAFYSDCEHVVLPVTSGQRITLTYNLYADEYTSSDRFANDLVHASQLPLHGILDRLFLQEDFMPDGGYVGVHTSHAYPHTSASSGLPSTLKGADAVAWETLRYLGCAVRLRPVVELPGWAHYGHAESQPCPAAELSDTSSEWLHSDTGDEALSVPPSESDREETRPDDMHPGQADGGDQTENKVVGPSPIDSGHSAAGEKDAVILVEGDDGDCSMAEGSQSPPSDPGRWEVDEEEVQALQKENAKVQSLPSTCFIGMQPACLLGRSSADDEDLKEATAARFDKNGLCGGPGCLVLGNSLSFHADHNLLEGDGGMKKLLDRWIGQKPRRQEGDAAQPIRLRYEDVAWLNHSGPRKEPQISYAVCGNEAGAATMYSSCAIVARVPPFSTRRALLRGEY